MLTYISYNWGNEHVFTQIQHAAYTKTIYLGDRSVHDISIL